MVSCRLVHHGAAATSSAKALAWIPTTQGTPNSDQWGEVAYASHAIVNVARRRIAAVDQDVQEPIWNVQQTLRTDYSPVASPTAPQPVITSLTYLRPLTVESNTTIHNIPVLACGFSNGTINIWERARGRSSNNKHDNILDNEWTEQVVVDATSSENSEGRSVTYLDGVWWKAIGEDTTHTFLVSCSSAGCSYDYVVKSNNNPSPPTTTTGALLTHHTANTVRLQPLSASTLMILVGTAAPRHNKIWVYTLELGTTGFQEPHLWGSLTGHEDWITCLDYCDATAWFPSDNNASEESSSVGMLASASQDCRIRLWKFSTTVPSSQKGLVEPVKNMTSGEESDVEGDDEKEDEDYDEHESRLEFFWQDKGATKITSVSLEALLLGHEEPVTAVQWFPGTSNVLVSSSMDRSILLWSPESEDDEEAAGIWTPMTRVGSAGGILGGSVGSTLLGYVNLALEPNCGRCLIGHAYGGALHVWHNHALGSIEEGGQSSQPQPFAGWKATPCVTGHFGAVSDLCFDAGCGDYLLTVSQDQTCRLWAPVSTADSDGATSTAWVELARPQVHGYDLTAITSVSSSDHRHAFVSGADEKELRTFEAPMTTLRILQATKSQVAQRIPGDAEDKENDVVERVERAYIPSLGLSNKASAADGAEEDAPDQELNLADSEQQRLQKKKAHHLPVERDLGALSLWLETRKLFGHNTELFCLTSTAEARTTPLQKGSNVLIASSTKARDVDAAAIRIWGQNEGACLQVLQGGHKSTVATLSFDAEGLYLASSGKDRRLCVWKQRQQPRVDDATSQGTKDLFFLAAAKDTAHKRIIWSVNFCPFDSSVLASGSRDGTVKIWKLSETENDALNMNTVFTFNPSTLNSTQKPDSVTALAFAPLPMKATPVDTSSNAVLALGLECGKIELWAVPVLSEADGSSAPQLVQVLPPSLCHVATVTKLAWRPLAHEDPNSNDKRKPFVLASASVDQGCRIFEVQYGEEWCSAVQEP